MNATSDDPILNSGAEPKIEAGADEIYIQAFRNVDLGFWRDEGGTDNWIGVTADRKIATKFRQHFADNVLYLTSGTNSWLSYRARGAFGLGLKMRGWIYAAKWKLEPDGKLLCLNNGKFVGTEGGYFYANSENVVMLKFIKI